MGRNWLSVSLGHGIRIGRSVADSDFQPRLPSWRRHELRAGLQAAAKARGEPMNREECDYRIDKALATGELDEAGSLAFLVTGTREEIVERAMQTCEEWGLQMTRQQAEDMADAALMAIGNRRRGKWAIVIAIAIVAVLALVRR